MVLVVEKKFELKTCENTTDKFAFRNLGKALRYAADWVDAHTVTENCGVAVVVWRKKVKFGFVSYHENGDKDEITFEDIPDADWDC